MGQRLARRKRSAVVAGALAGVVLERLERDGLAKLVMDEGAEDGDGTP